MSRRARRGAAGRAGSAGAERGPSRGLVSPAGFPFLFLGAGVSSVIRVLSRLFGSSTVAFMIIIISTVFITVFINLFNFLFNFLFLFIIFMYFYRR